MTEIRCDRGRTVYRTSGFLDAGIGSCGCIPEVDA